MQILQKFQSEASQSLDIGELSRLVCDFIHRICNKPLSGGIFLPNHSFEEWDCYRSINSTISNLSSFSDQLSGIAEYFSGFPGTVYCYTKREALEEVYGAHVPLFFDGHYSLIYAAESDSETLAVCILLTQRPLSNHESQCISQIMDIYAKQLSKTVQVHNRLKGIMGDETSPWEDMGMSDFEI